jgi:hypothetical protein
MNQNEDTTAPVMGIGMVVPGGSKEKKKLCGRNVGLFVVVAATSRQHAAKKRRRRGEKRAAGPCMDIAV